MTDCLEVGVIKPATTQVPTSIFGIPRGTVGRVVANEAFTISGIIIHCINETLAALDNSLRCATPQSIAPGSIHNSYHYGLGQSGGLHQYVQDADISWGLGAYLKNVYPAVPPANDTIYWPVLQTMWGESVTPDTYVINFALATGQPAATDGCFECQTCSGLPTTQHNILIQALAYLSETYNIPVDSDHIQFHDNISCDAELKECICGDIECLLAEVNAYCPPCPNGQESPGYTGATVDDTIKGFIGIIESCCEGSDGCLVEIPPDPCIFGNLIPPGDINGDTHFVGLNLNGDGDYCLVHDNIDVECPITGTGIDSSPFTIDRCCIEGWLDSFAPLSQVNRIMGVDDSGCWTLENTDDFVDRILCAEPEDAVTPPTWVLSKNDTECPVWTTPQLVVEAGLNVVDSDCIDLTLSNGNLTVEPIIAPAQGGVPNSLSCLVDGLYVASVIPVGSDCLSVTDNGDGTYTLEPIIAPPQSGTENAIDCIAGQGLFAPTLTFTDGDSIDFIISGPFDDVITAEVILDPDGGNLLQITPDGLLATLLVSDTSCIDLTIVGNTLSADPIISGDSNNLLVCQGNGLYVGFSTANTDCINLSFVGGVLTATPTVSVDVGGVQNALSCLGSGLYVPRGANTNVVGPIVGDGSDLNPIDIDFGLLDNQDLCDLGAVIPLGTLTYIVGTDNADCLRKQSLEDAIANAIIAQDTDCINLSLVGNVLTADPIISGDVGNILQCLPTGLYVPQGAGITANDTSCIDLDLTNGILTATPIIDSIIGDNALVCGVNGLYVPRTANLSVLDTNCIDLELVSGVLTAQPILNPAGDNQLTCTASGLYVPPSGTITAVLDTPCIDLTIVGGVLTANPILDPALDNVLQCTANGLYVAGTDVCSFFITDGAATELIECGDTITFEGINGLTPIVSGTDKVTLDAHHLCGSGPPVIAPPYDADQYWGYYGSNNGLFYHWSCNDLVWQTTAHLLNETAPPDGLTCNTNPVINGVTEGVWTPGSSIYKIPAGNGQATVDRTYLLTEPCKWAKIEGSGTNFMGLTVPLLGVPEVTPQKIPFNAFSDNDLGIVDIGNSRMLIEEAGCYTIETNVAMNIAIASYDGIILRTTAYVNGFPIEHVAENGGWSQTNPSVPLPNATPMAGSMTLCLNAGDIVEIYQTLDSTGQVPTYDIELASLRMTLMV